jgi:hypothetical protein
MRNPTFLEMQRLTAEAIRSFKDSGGVEAALAGISDALARAYDLGFRDAAPDERMAAENAALKALVDDLQSERDSLSRKCDALRVASYGDTNRVSLAKASEDRVRAELTEAQYALITMMFEGIVRQIKDSRGGQGDGQE